MSEQHTTAQHAKLSAEDTKLIIYQMLITAQTSLQGIKLDTDFLKSQETTINTAIKAYNVAEASFALYAGEGQGGVDLSKLLPQVADLAKEVTQVISTLIKPMAQSQQKVVEIHPHFEPAKPAISLKTILGYLQMAAEVATVIPGASPWASLAQLVLSLVQKAAAARDAAKEVDLSKLHQLPLIS